MGALKPPPTLTEIKRMEILDYLFEKGKPPLDESEMPVETSILQDYEALVALLTYATWKGEPRQTSTITLGYSSGSWFARLNDPENTRSTTGGGKSIAEAIESLSSIVLSGRNARWYYWKGNPTSNGRKPVVSSVKSESRKRPRGKSA